MKEGSYVMELCAGIGGFSLGLRLTGEPFRTVCYVEWDKYCQQVLRQRMRDGVLDDAPIWSDLKTFDGTEWRGVVDLITAGFPCTPFSTAGKQQGEADERNLWPDVARVIREVLPASVFLENVPALLAARGSDGRPYFGRILGDLAACGYDARWDCIPASAVGAHIESDRVWVVASRSKADSVRRKGCGQRALGPWNQQQFERLVRDCVEHGVPAGGLGRISDGVSNRVGKLRALGGAVIPAVVARAWANLNKKESDDVLAEEKTD